MQEWAEHGEDLEQLSGISCYSLRPLTTAMKLWSSINLTVFASYIHLNDFYFLFFRFKGGNYRLNVLPGSKLNILCPHVAVSLIERQDTDNGLNYENFWRVDRKSYETCNVNSTITNNKIFLQCRNPRQIQFETLVFQPFNADPSRVFKKGTVYYFICKCGLYLMNATMCSAHCLDLINFMMLFEDKHTSSTYN